MEKDDLIRVRVPKEKRIALIAHDGKKTELFNWVKENREILKNHRLCGTGTTSTMIREKFNLEIESFFSGPLGGDQQVGAAISKGEIDYLIFFWDPLEAQPHDPDVKALLRIAVLYDVPVAMSQTAATMLLKSQFTSEEFEKYVINPGKNIDERVVKLNKNPF